MAGDVLGDGDDGDVRAERQRLVHAGAAPGVVDDEVGVAPLQRGGEGGEVLHVVDDGAGVIEIDHAGVGLEALLHLFVPALVELAGDAAL